MEPLYVTLLVPRIVGWLLIFGKFVDGCYKLSETCGFAIIRVDVVKN
jgi:hypothetical protein